MRFMLLIGILLVMNSGCSGIKEKDITEIPQTALDGIVLVDVRTAKEFEEGHLENALNIDWMGDGFMSEFEKIDKDKTIYLYCRSGRRSASATKFLDSLGYLNVYNLKGGYLAYKAANE